MATNNSTQTYIDTAVPSLVNQVRWTMSVFGYTKEEAIAYQRTLTVAGPAVWHSLSRDWRHSMATYINYTPETWSESQRALHVAASLEEAFQNASCLAGGWYRRPVTIDSRVTADNDEEYMMRPADVPALDGWSPCYTVERAS